MVYVGLTQMMSVTASDVATLKHTGLFTMVEGLTV